MRLRFLTLLALVGVCALMLSSTDKGLIEVDTIKAVVYGPERTDLILSSDLVRPGIDGAQRTLQDMVYERLMYQEAMRFQIVPGENALDKYLQEIQREHEMTEDDLKNIFRQAGYTYAQGRAEFGRIKAVNQVIGFRVMSKLTVPQREIEAYYNEHSEYIPARYYLQHAIAPMPTKASEREKQNIKLKLTELLAQDSDGDKIAWTDSYWLEHDEVAEDKQCVYELEVGKHSELIEIDEGFLVFKLIDKEDMHAVPLEDRYDDILNTLRSPKFTQQFAAYKQDLEDNASFIYF